MNKELNRKLEEIAFRLQRLTDDYHELLNELSHMEEVKKSKKVIYEQYITLLDEPSQFYTLKTQHERNTVINVCDGYKYAFSGLCELIQLGAFTRKIIETYIPSQNLVLVVEL